MLAVRIALRYLFSRKSHSAVNVISIVAMAGVAIASAAMVIVLSVFNGFADFSTEKLSDVSPDLLIEPKEGKIIANATELAASISTLDCVSSADQVIEEKAFAVAGDRQMPVTLMGVEPDSPMAKGFSGKVIDGEWPTAAFTAATPGAVSVGTANTLRSLPASPVTIKLYEPRRKGRINPANPFGAFRSDSVTVTAVFRLDENNLDADRIVVPIEITRHLLNYPDEATSIAVSIAPGVDINRAARRISSILPKTLTVKDRLQQQAPTLRMINVEKWVTMLMLTFILVVASFNILSAMSMLIVDKKPNRMIMTAMGATDGMISSIFAWLAFMVSTIGGLIGVGVGTGLSIAQQFGGFIKLNAADPSQLAINVYPVAVHPTDILLVIAVVVGIGAATAAIIRSVTRSA